MLVGAAVGAVVIGGGIVIYNNREAVGDAIEKSMEMRGEAELLNAQSQMEFWRDPYGAFSSVFGNDDSSKENPNVGKDLTDEERRTVWAVAVQEVREGGSQMRMAK
ncbi:hypothetical protein NHF43_09400 [Escherichia coli]|uniref:hypothetical protein n=1 Tax=Escherichia coli TaxID=562 RepID=UPI0021B039A6|nr:hypothetical protein [Escherichia coli]UWX26086.1 hypothetical protein NHF43_09400 [Escherichia coli]